MIVNWHRQGELTFYRDNNEEQESYTVKVCVLAQFVSRQALAQNPRVTYSGAYVKSEQVSFWTNLRRSSGRISDCFPLRVQDFTAHSELCAL